MHNDIDMEQRLVVGLEAADIKAIQRLMEGLGLPSQASAVRFALRRAAGGLGSEVAAAGESVKEEVVVKTVEGGSGEVEGEKKSRALAPEEEEFWGGLGAEVEGVLKPVEEPEVVERVLDTTESQVRVRAVKAIAGGLPKPSERSRAMREGKG